MQKIFIDHFLLVNPYISARYVLNDYDNPYQATSGNITITKLDTAKRKLEANFNLVVRQNKAGVQKTIRITNGEMKLTNWRTY
ncbi:MAG: hypothetical protein ACJ75B_15375 [Flavisolibacter sp.]